MPAAGRDAAVVEHEDHVGVLHRGDALRDDDLRRVGDLRRERLADQRVGARVDGACRVVENQNLRVLQQGARDAQALLLAAGDVGAALFDVGVVALREGADEVVRLRELAGVDELLVRRVLVAPAQVLLDRAGEQHVFLQHHRDRAAQRVEVVAAHVDAADLHGALLHVVQAGDELHKAGF